jgi:RNA polymerase sigma-70 factor (ECF subfamily)
MTPGEARPSAAGPSDPRRPQLGGERTAGRALDGKAFEILVREHHRGLMAYALSLVRDEGAAEDIVQDAFLAAFENLARFDVRRDFGRWLRGIARIKYLERARRRRETPVESAILDEIERQHAEWDRARFEEGGDVFAALKRCLDRLSELARKTVDSFYMRRLSCAAIAKALATSEVAVRKRLERARESLGRCIRRELGPGGVD